MTSMSRAGDPAHHTPRGAAPHRQADDAVVEGRATNDPFATFLAHGAQATSNVGVPGEPSTPEGQVADDWCSADTLAVTSEATSPVLRVATRIRNPKQRSDWLGRVRNLYAFHLDVPVGSVTREEAQGFAWHQLTAEDAQSLQSSIYRRCTSQSSRNLYSCAGRAILRQCFKQGLISALRRDLLFDELYTRAVGPTTKRRRLSHEDIAALLHACSTVGTPLARARNTAIVALFRTSGIRISELVKLRLSDWDRVENTALLRDTKNGRNFLVLLHPVAVEYLDRWARLRGTGDGPLFTSLNGGMKHLDTVSVRWMLEQRRLAAGIQPFGPHDFRRTFATDLLETFDGMIVSKLMNHQKLDSTMRYDLRGEADMRSAVNHLTLPIPLPSADDESSQEVPK